MQSALSLSKFAIFFKITPINFHLRLFHFPPLFHLPLKICNDFKIAPSLFVKIEKMDPLPFSSSENRSFHQDRPRTKLAMMWKMVPPCERSFSIWKWPISSTSPPSIFVKIEKMDPAKPSSYFENISFHQDRPQTKLAMMWKNAPMWT